MDNITLQIKTKNPDTKIVNISSVIRNTSYILNRHSSDTLVSNASIHTKEEEQLGSRHHLSDKEKEKVCEDEHHKKGLTVLQFSQDMEKKYKKNQTVCAS